MIELAVRFINADARSRPSKFVAAAMRPYWALMDPILHWTRSLSSKPQLCYFPNPTPFSSFQNAVSLQNEVYGLARSRYLDLAQSITATLRTGLGYWLYGLSAL